MSTAWIQELAFSWVSVTYNTHYKYSCAINCSNEVCSNVNVRMHNTVVLNIYIIVSFCY